MPTIVIQNDHIIRALSVMLDPDCDPERIAGFADYYSVDMPEFPQWCEELRKKYPAVAPSRVVLTNSQGLCLQIARKNFGQRYPKRMRL